MQAQQIRLAATLLLLRDRKSGGPWEVFITRRPETMKFLPGYFVYPGGALEEGDYGEEICSRCTSSAWETRDELAHKVAAIRECYEEVGILLARDATGRWTEENQQSNGEMPMALPTLDSLRHLSRFPCTATILKQTERNFVQPFRQG